jgi:rhodanese-related sulfurtransferase
MQQFLEFAGNNLFLFGALVVVLVLLAQNIIAGTDKTAVTPGGATELINREEAIVVDVRPMNDFSSGHIINAINIPANSLSKQLAQLEKHKDKPVIVACRSGAQSAAACKQLRKEGFEKVHNLKGGMLAWESDNFPVSRKK